MNSALKGHLCSSLLLDNKIHFHPDEIQHLGSLGFQGSYWLQVGALFVFHTQQISNFPSLTSGKQLQLFHGALMLSLPDKARESYTHRVAFISYSEALFTSFRQQHLEKLHIWAPVWSAFHVFPNLSGLLNSLLVERPAPSQPHQKRAASSRSAWHQRRCRPLTDNKSTWCHIWLLVWLTVSLGVSWCYDYLRPTAL